MLHNSRLILTFPGPYIGDMNYAICFRRIRGSRSLKFVDELRSDVGIWFIEILLSDSSPRSSAWTAATPTIPVSTRTASSTSKRHSDLKTICSFPTRWPTRFRRLAPLSSADEVHRHASLTALRPGPSCSGSTRIRFMRRRRRLDSGCNTRLFKHVEWRDSSLVLRSNNEIYMQHRKKSNKVSNPKSNSIAFFTVRSGFTITTTKKALKPAESRWNDFLIVFCRWDFFSANPTVWVLVTGF